jgi:competence protein ComEC
MGLALEKPRLFPELKSFIYFSLALLVLLVFRLAFEYKQYHTFIAKPFYYINAIVITSYEKTKNDKHYTVLKLKSDEGFTFYTTSHRRENFNDKRLRLQIFPNKSMEFKDYLGTFYVKSKIKFQEKIPKTVKDKLHHFVSMQHHENTLGSFYNAIFFATPIEVKLREKIALLGVSHLVALSGFHLGILWGLVYGLLLLFYKLLQQKYFPYRHALFDVGLVSMGILGIYVWFVGFPPSLLRSFAMVFVGWGILLLGMELLSFTFLASVFLVLSVLFPSLLVSLSFWLSIAGVFYIFLLLQYTKKWNKWFITLGVIPVGIFILMLPIVHTVFGVTSGYQLLSPLLSILFIPFYPLVMVLHLVGWGGILDEVLLGIFSLPSKSTEHLVPWWALVMYLGLSFASIRSKKAFYILLIFAMLYFIYLFIFIK